ncbi:MAG: hypothetical protein ACMUIL_11755 [bacterium]
MLRNCIVSWKNLGNCLTPIGDIGNCLVPIREIKEYYTGLESRRSEQTNPFKRLALELEGKGLRQSLKGEIKNEGSGALLLEPRPLTT